MAIALYKQISIEELQTIVSNSTSFSEVMRTLGYKSVTSQQSKLKDYLDSNQIDYSHFKGHAWNKKELEVLNSNEFGVISKRIIRELLLKERPYKCECCGISEWQGKTIILQVHHIDGNRNNNVRDNLILLCPNCHSQTDNWCNKNNHGGNNIDDKTFLEALNYSNNICEACRFLGISPNQNNYLRAKKLLNLQNLE